MAHVDDVDVENHRVCKMPLVLNPWGLLQQIIKIVTHAYIIIMPSQNCKKEEKLWSLE